MVFQVVTAEIQLSQLFKSGYSLCGFHPDSRHLINIPDNRHQTSPEIQFHSQILIHQMSFQLFYQLR